MAAAAVLLALGGGPARGDDDGDDGGGGAGAGAGAGAGGGAAGGGPGGDGAGFSAGDGRGGLGPNPGRIPMPPAWERSLQRFFGATPPPRRPAPRADLVAAGLSPAQREALRRQGFTVLAERAVPGLARLRGPAGLAAPAALARLRAAAPGAVADRNHTYRLAAEEEVAPAMPAADATPAAPAPPAACGAAGPLVALVDTGVDARHPELAGRVLRQEVLRGPGRRPARTAHGTAVALRLATAAPAARLVVLDAFHLGPNGEAADAYDLAAALARAEAIGAVIVNVSVVGPANTVVDRLGADAAAKGVLFVAAAGNDGPRAAPLHPAAYSWAVAVSAVDSQGRPWVRSAAGRHIAFAAHGVQVRLQPGAAAPPRAWSGTSFAAPLVAAALAGAPGQGAARIEHLVGQARDAGTPGRDPVYGWGVVEAPDCAAGG